MNQDQRKYYIFIAIFAIIVGAVGGYLFRRDNGSIREVIVPTETKEVAKTEPLPVSRHTAIVQAVKQVGPAIVGITTTSYTLDTYSGSIQEAEGVGSGVIIRSNGYIVTNYHVVGEAKQVIVSLSDGTSTQGRVVGIDPLTDLAVVKVDTDKELPVALLGKSSTLQVGEAAIAIGNPLGLEFQGSVTTGVISALHRTIDVEMQRFPLIQTDAPINPGNSGGALVNADGEVIGINSSKIAKEGIEGIGFAIPIDEAKPIIEQLIDQGKVSRPYLGIVALDKNTGAKYGISLHSEGLTIVRMDPNGPAYREGLRPGDIITAIDGNEVHTLVDLKQALDSYKGGQIIQLTVLREGSPLTMSIRVGVMA